VKPPVLIAAPYAPPACKVGGTLACTLRGDVPVDGITDAPIPWPYTRYRGDGVPRSAEQILIVCGDLERAIRTESNRAVTYHWAISRHMVARLRRALGVGRNTPGSTALQRQHARRKLTNITPRQLRRVRDGIAAGMKPIAIATSTGVSVRAIWRIRNGETFAE
jgi:hypothetical protein